MSDARMRHVLQTITIQTASRPRTAVLSAGALAVAALTLTVRYGGLAGFAVLIAVAAMCAATVLWLRLRASERSHAALALNVADLTMRLDLLSVASLPVPSVAPSADPTLGAAETGVAPVDATIERVDSDASGPDTVVETLPVVEEPEFVETIPADGVAGAVALSVALDTVLPTRSSVLDRNDSQPLDSGSATTTKINDDLVPVGESEPSGPDCTEETDTLPPAIPTGELAIIVGSDPDEPHHAEAAVMPLVAELHPPEAMPAFTLTALNGAVVTDAVLVGTPAVVVFWRPGCQHCQRLTPELVAWESLQGPRLIVFAACDGPTAFRAGLPGLVILDPGFTVGQGVGAPGTPAALPLDATGRPSGPVVAGASAVTALLLDSMRAWALVDVEPMPQLSTIDVELHAAFTTDLDTDMDADTETVEPAKAVSIAPLTVLLRRVEEIPSDEVASASDWDAESVVRRAG